VKTGDVKTWATEELHKSLSRIINAKAARRTPYYILVIVKEGYDGPIGAVGPRGKANELLGNTEKRGPEVDLSGKKVVHNKILILDQAPAIPMLGSSLWKIGNVKGKVDCVYILPLDTPMIHGFEVDGKGEESRIVHEGGKRMPLVYD